MFLAPSHAVSQQGQQLRSWRVCFQHFLMPADTGADCCLYSSSSRSQFQAKKSERCQARPLNLSPPRTLVEVHRGATTPGFIETYNVHAS